jgi:DNA-binding CsgD family transcriptional regulator
MRPTFLSTVPAGYGAVEAIPTRRALQAAAAASGLIPDIRGIRLTPRELEVLALLAEGLPNKTISRRLDISTSTVKCHVTHIFDELNAVNRLQAVIIALREGLIPEHGAAAAPPPRTPLSAVRRGAPAQLGTLVAAE